MATVAQLLTMIRMRARWPTTNAPVPDDSLLLLANDEIASFFWPLLLASQGDYYTTYQDCAIVVGRARYRLPKNGFGPIKDALLVSTSGRESSLSFCNLGEVGKGDVSSADPYMAFIDGDLLGLTPAPTVTDGTVLRIRYYRKPNVLIPTDAGLGNIVAPVLSITSATRLVADEDLASFIGDVGRVVDILGQGSGHQVLADSMTVTANSAAGAGLLNLDFAAIPDVVEVGDSLVWSGYTPFVQLPDFMVPLLSARVAMLALDIEGDEPAFKRKAALVDELQKAAVGALEPRYEGEPRMTQPRGTPHRPGR